MGSSSTGELSSKIKGAPDYDEADYWDRKFAAGEAVGEWLGAGDELLDTVLSDLDRRQSFTIETGPSVLHLGPGISDLGTKLCEEFMKRGWMGNGIVNVDFSAEAVRLGQEREKRKDVDRAMPWRLADLRSWNDMANLSQFAPFDVVLDKGTSDALGTAPPQTFSSSDDMSSACPTVREAVLAAQGERTVLSAVEILALQLVPLTQKDTTALLDSRLADAARSLAGQSIGLRVYAQGVSLDVYPATQMITVHMHHIKLSCKGFRKRQLVEACIFEHGRLASDNIFIEVKLNQVSGEQWNQNSSF